MDFYPKNTLQNYKTRVCITEEFAGKWEVGLVNITYPRMWYNVNEEDAVCYVQFMNWDTKTATIPIGRYNSMEELIEALNKALNSTLPPTSHQVFQLSYDRLTRKVTYGMISNPKRITTIKLVLPENPGNEISSDDIINSMSTSVVGSSFSPGVASILGFEDTQDRKTWNPEFHMQNVGTFTGKHVADLNRGIHSLYVYCDIMEPCPVGDARVPLLRIVPLKETSNNSTSTMQCTQTFSHVHYHILRHRYITEVEIDIKDSMGRPVPFERGELMVTLHLRRAEF